MTARSGEEKATAEVQILGLASEISFPDECRTEVHRAIYALLETYNNRSHDVYRLMPRKARAFITHSQEARLILTNALCGAMDAADEHTSRHMRNLLTPINDLFPATKPENIACIYVVRYTFPDEFKGYVGRTTDLQKRVTQHQTDAKTDDPASVHHREAKGHEDRDILVIFRLEDEEDLGLGEDDLDTLSDIVAADKTEAKDDEEGGLMYSMQIVAEQVCADLLGSYAPDELLQHQPLGLRQRNYIADEVAKHALSLAEWTQIMDRNSEAPARGLDSILPWITKTTGNNNRWTKLKFQADDIWYEIFECKVKVYKRGSGDYLYADLISYRIGEGPGHDREFVLCVGKARRGLKVGTEVTFVVEKAWGDVQHPHAYFVPADLDTAKYTEYQAVPRVAFRVDWGHNMGNERDYLVPGLDRHSNERAEMVIDLLHYLDGRIDNTNRLPVTLWEQSIDWQCKLTTSRLRLRGSW